MMWGIQIDDKDSIWLVHADSVSEAMVKLENSKKASGLELWAGKYHVFMVDELEETKL